MRRLLLEKLLAWKEKADRKPLILQGTRQVGKTTLLEQFGREFYPAIHLINFEKERGLETIFNKSLDPVHLIREFEYFLNRSIDPKHDLLIFDEIQACPLALTSLKYFAEDMPQMSLCAAGSLLGIYLGPVSFPVGKVDLITLCPMTFEEFLMALDEQRILELLRNLKRNDRIPESAHSHIFELLKHYFIVGGLPEVVKIFCEEKKNLHTAFIKVREKQSAILDTYMADIAKHSGKVNAMHIARILQAIPAQMAQSQDSAASKFKFKGVVPGIDRYSRLVNAIDWLEAARLIIKVPIINSGNLPFSAYATEGTFKLYLFDIGMLGAMSNLSPQAILQYDYGSYKGYFAENYVAQTFLAHGHRHLYCWQEKLAEVEFLDEEEGLPVPIEVKSGWVTHAKSAKIFADKYRAPYRVNFSAKPLAVNHELHSYPLYLADWYPLQKK
ncbi:MAG: AAA family ATPase [Parachlamydia sp.]|nr:AAA family ATPase [Parachlamydia sp.]